MVAMKQHAAATKNPSERVANVVRVVCVDLIAFSLKTRVAVDPRSRA
jgi:hypothetical protein